MLSFESHIIDGGPWSISKLGTIEKCSLQYDYKYGRQKQPELVQFAESRVGTAVHKALELALGGANVSAAIAQAIDMYELSSVETEEVDARVDQIEKFVERMAAFRNKHGVQEDCVEQKWGMGTDLAWTGFFGDKKRDAKVFFRGVVDYAMYTRSRDLIIIDHKSGKARGLEYYQTQLRVYALMGLARFPEARGVQTAINFVLADQIEWDKFAPAEKIRKEYAPWLQEHMSKVCAGLLEEPTPNKTKLCDWCGYKPICPAHREVTSGACSEK